MLIVPLQPVPSQTLTVSLAGQNVQLQVFQKYTGLYMVVAVNGVVIVGAVICENENLIVRNKYLGFIGDFAFIDNQGSDDPDYTGLGSRFSLAYIEQSDFAAAA